MNESERADKVEERERVWILGGREEETNRCGGSLGGVLRVGGLCLDHLRGLVLDRLLRMRVLGLGGRVSMELLAFDLLLRYVP